MIRHKVIVNGVEDKPTMFYMQEVPEVGRILRLYTDHTISEWKVKASIMHGYLDSAVPNDITAGTIAVERMGE